jgi:hypothetical protein
MTFDAFELYNIVLVCALPFYFINTKKLNFLVYPILVSPIIYVLAIYFNLLDFIGSQRLIFAYMLVGAIFVYTLVKLRSWDLTQAVPITMILIMAGGLYWEIPYLIRNAFLSGFEWDWILHISRLASIAALVFFIGFSPASSFKNKILLLSLGFALSIVIMSYYPVPPHTPGEDVWDTPIYLLNRIVDTGILFSIFNTVKRPVRGILRNLKF